MNKSFYLEDISIESSKNPRHFLRPSEEEINSLKVGEMVRLFFVLKEQKDNCRAERMWVEIEHIKKDKFIGYLTNQPFYIKDLQLGDLVEFNRNNIATIIVKSLFNENKEAVISNKALEYREINWLYREVPLNDSDSGWQLFHGDENEDYANEPNNFVIVSLSKVLDFEPRLEKVFASSHNAFEWNKDMQDFVEVFDF